MKTELITISEYCQNYGVELSFITALEESGLIILTVVGEDKCIHTRQLEELERYIHFHYDLEIDVNGIDAIMNLLEKVRAMQKEIRSLKSHIHLHDPES